MKFKVMNFEIEVFDIVLVAAAIWCIYVIGWTP